MLPHDLLLALFGVEAGRWSRAFNLLWSKVFLYICGTRELSKTKYQLDTVRDIDHSKLLLTVALMLHVHHGLI